VCSSLNFFYCGSPSLVQEKEKMNEDAIL
jgi:hypothetical protein